MVCYETYMSQNTKSNGVHRSNEFDTAREANLGTSKFIFVNFQFNDFTYSFLDLQVISGGVARNNFFAKALEILCSEKGFQFVRTPPQLCNDNGVMIAWNGCERWIANTGVIRDRNEIETVTVEKTAPLGENWIQKVRGANIKCKLVKLKTLMAQ